MSDISAIYLQNTQYEINLNVLLVPPNEIRGDVRDVAGRLGFIMSDVNYIMKKEYPFLYLIDQWIKRTGAESATLQYLQAQLQEMGRLDAVAEIESAIAELKDKPHDDLDRIANTHNSMLRRTASCMSLCPSARKAFIEDSIEESIPCGDRVDLGSNLSIEKHSKRSVKSFFGSKLSLNSKKPSVEKHTRTTRNSSKMSKPLKPEKEKAADEAPVVYVVHTTEDIDQLKAIRDMVEKLRGEYGIDVRSEMFEFSDYEDDKAYYLYSNLITAEYVMYVCTETTAREDEDSKKKEFVKKFILDFMFEDSSYKSKYIPVLLPGCDKRDVPFFLHGPTAYFLENKDFYDDVHRRVFRIEKYSLGALPAKRPQLKPIDISKMFEQKQEA